jgi:excisionase family DNA binding protein
MIGAHKRRRGKLGAGSGKTTAKKRQKFQLTPAPPKGAEGVERDAWGRPVCPPGTMLVVSSTSAWRALCAKTGCSMGWTTFYSWIRSGRIESIRVGRKYYVKVTTLDNLVALSLTGERW